MLYFQSEGSHQAENLRGEMFSVHLTTDEDKTSEGFTDSMTSRETREYSGGLAVKHTW